MLSTPQLSVSQAVATGRFGRPVADPADAPAMAFHACLGFAPKSITLLVKALLGER